MLLLESLNDEFEAKLRNDLVSRAFIRLINC